MNCSEFMSSYEVQCKELKLPMESGDVASWIAMSDITPANLDVLHSFLTAMQTRKQDQQVKTLKKLSRLPQKKPCRFDSFDMSLLNSVAQEQIQSLATLSFINARRNVIMIGPPGTGKTHLAMAIGNACCESRMKAYFIKMDELRDRFKDAIRSGSEGKLLNGLAKNSCLIIDEIGYCHFNRSETLLFFQLIDRFSLKETGSIVLTSNKDTSQWKDLFEEDDALECTIDRLWDEALCYTFTGRSYRGKNQEFVSLDFLELKN